MFSFTSVFDCLLYRPPCTSDIDEYTEVQRVLREEIVNPLRKNWFVRADRVMKLRQLLDSLTSVRGLMSEEKGKNIINANLIHKSTVRDSEQPSNIVNNFALTKKFTTYHPHSKRTTEFPVESKVETLPISGAVIWAKCSFVSIRYLWSGTSPNSA